MKHIPTVGEHLYVYTPCSDYWVSSCREPYTVIEVKGNVIRVQHARCVYKGLRYFDTLPDYIEENPNGQILKFRWSEKKQRWQESPAGSYPYVAVFGEWDYTPYLN